MQPEHEVQSARGNGLFMNPTGLPDQLQLKKNGRLADAAAREGDWQS